MITLIFICNNLVLRIAGKIAEIRTRTNFEKRINLHRLGLEYQHGRRLIVLKH